MVVFPNCKINLGLNIISKRDDGYHNLETVFYPLPFHDVLEVIQSEVTSTEIVASGINIEDNANNNLCFKAYYHLKKDFPQLPFVKIYLRKNVFIGGGLGGGSSDGVFMLKLLNEKFNLNIGDEQLLQYALQLGSDCPFFIINKPCFAQQRGEVLEKVDLDLSGYKMILVNPQIHINTAWAFAQIKPSTPKKGIKEIITQPLNTWKDDLQNDFEQPVFAYHSSIQKIKKDLYNAGAIYAAMSGSGSTVFGIFEKINDINVNEIFENYDVKHLTL